MSKDYYKGFKRVIKDGVPVRVPVWFSDLTPEGKRATLSGKTFSTPQQLTPK